MTGVEVGMVTIKEPFLVTENIGAKATIAFRFAIPDLYQSGNDLTMRAFLYRVPTDALPDPCFVIRVDSHRLRAGEGVTVYGPQRWLQMDPPPSDGLTISAVQR